MWGEKNRRKKTHLVRIKSVSSLIVPDVHRLYFSPVHCFCLQANSNHGSVKARPYVGFWFTTLHYHSRMWTSGIPHVPIKGNSNAHGEPTARPPTVTRMMSAATEYTAHRARWADRPNRRQPHDRSKHRAWHARPEGKRRREEAALAASKHSVLREDVAVAPA